MTNEEDILKKYSTLVSLILLAIFVLWMIYSILIAVIGGLLLAYIFYPIYKRTAPLVKSNTLATFIVMLIPILIILIPLWFIVPLVIEEVFKVFQLTQTLNIGALISSLFPTASEQFLIQASATSNAIVSKASSAILNGLVNLFVDAPAILLNIFIMGFVFFYSMRDGEKMKAYISEISPFTKVQEKLIVKQFIDVTDSILYGQVISGLVQGIFAGIGLLIFGVDNALILSLIAIFLSIIPHVGPSFVWIPVTIFLFATGNPIAASLYLAYNVLFVSTIDNVVRSYIVSKKTNISPGVVFVGMIGGIFAFGIIGLILGPLLFAYLFTFLELYNNKSFVKD